MKTFDELVQDKPGTIYHDEFDEGIRFIVMRGPASLCSYLGIPLAHPLSAFAYDDLPLPCHGGLTFSQTGKDKWPEGYWWYGWDYGHSGDFCFYDLQYGRTNNTDHKWTVEEVIKDSWEAIYEFKKLVKFAEKICAKNIGDS